MPAAADAPTAQRDLGREQPGLGETGVQTQRLAEFALGRLEFSAAQLTARDPQPEIGVVGMRLDQISVGLERGGVESLREEVFRPLALSLRPAPLRPRTPQSLPIEVFASKDRRPVVTGLRRARRPLSALFLGAMLVAQLAQSHHPQGAGFDELLVQRQRIARPPLGRQGVFEFEKRPRAIRVEIGIAGLVLESALEVFTGLGESPFVECPAPETRVRLRAIETREGSIGVTIVAAALEDRVEAA